MYLRPGQPLRVCLIGVSGYGNCHYKTILSLVEEGILQLCAATVINADDEPEKCAHMRAIGCRIYDDYQTMLAHEAERVDLCCIPTGIGWHCTMTVDALNAGLHVLVEKPPAATLEEVETMRQARNRSGRELFVGFQNMYAPACWEIKDLLLSGQFGDLQRIRVAALWPRSHNYYKRTPWAGKLYHNQKAILDSPANNAMAHFILMGLFWGGTQRQSCAEIADFKAATYRAQAIESFDTFSAWARLNSGAELSINMSHSAEAFMTAEIIVETTAGHYLWKDGMGSKLVHTSPPSEQTIPPYERTRHVMFRHIVEQLHGQDSPVCTLELAREHTQFITRIHEELNIHDVPNELRQVCREDNESFTQVRGLDEALLKAHRSCSWLTDLSPPPQIQPLVHEA